MTPKHQTLANYTGNHFLLENRCKLKIEERREEGREVGRAKQVEKKKNHPVD